MITAEAILNPGFWGRTSSSQIAIEAVNNFYNETMTRVNDFLKAIANAAVGATISIHDDPTIQGHLPSENTYFPGITYTFISPGINAPSYVLGPLFAQYFFTMCTIFQSGGACSGHLNPPMPQFYTDLVDYVRASHAGWDTPQPNVIGLVCSVAPPTVLQCGSTTESEAFQSVCIPLTCIPAADATPGSVAPVVVVPGISAVNIGVCGTTGAITSESETAITGGGVVSSPGLAAGLAANPTLLWVGAGILALFLVGRKKQ
jgi:hypothetical protein